MPSVPGSKRFQTGVGSIEEPATSLADLSRTPYAGTIEPTGWWDI